MTRPNLDLDSFLGHLGGLPDRLPSHAEAPVPADVTASRATDAPEGDVAAALSGDLGQRWTGHDALSPRARRLAAFLVASPCGDGLRRLASDLAENRSATPAEDAAARAACEATAARHAFVGTVFQDLLASRAGLPMPAWAFAGLAATDPLLHVLALDHGRRTRLPRALATYFHHRVEAARGKPEATPRFEALATKLSEGLRVPA
jgi:hypothetical protein